MGAVGGLLGLGGGAAGSGFSGPSSANILNPTTVDQANTAFNTAQGALGQQQSFVNALGAQNGIQNQSNVFNQLQGVANGTGPNPAQAMLNQATGQNVANQAALMAGQRGSNANVGLIARQAAMQGANTQQQAVGQNAALQSQQQLNALSGLGNLATQQVGQQQQAVSGLNTAAQGEQQNLLNSIAQQNNANVGMQSNVNTANAGLANTTMQNQAGLLGGLGNATGGISKAIGGLFAAKGGKVPRQHYNSGTPPGGAYDPNFKGLSDDQWNQGAANPNSLPPTGPTPAPVQVQAPAAAVPQAVSAAPKAMSAPNSKPAANNQSSSPSASVAQSSPDFGNRGANALYQGMSSFGKFLSDSMTPQEAPTTTGQATSDQMAGGPGDTMGNYDTSGPNNAMANSPDMSSDTMTAAKGGKVPAMVSPGERYLPPKEVAEVKAGKKSPMEAGEKIPGKPKVGGAKNDYANDTVPKTLEAGGLVLPRSVTQAKHPHWAAMKFVQAHMAKGGKVLPAKPKAKK